jgi:hypothetical protein
MSRVKGLILRIFDDTGADTFEKHWAQIEYTAYWCMQMVLPAARINGVIPEGVDDVTLMRNGSYELHQVKCRDESQPPWTTAEVLPILCAQYHRRGAFNLPCQFHFVSDHLADNKTQLRPGQSFGPLYRLKVLLDIAHEGQDFTSDELLEFTKLKTEIIPKIKEILSAKYGEQVSDELACDLLHSTWIDTKSSLIRNYPLYHELSAVFLTTFPGQPACTMPQLQVIYLRILQLIVQKVTTGKTLEERTISRDDILNCRSEAIAPEYGLPNLNELPGDSRMEKKALYSGFDPTELPVFALQRIKADAKRRKLETLGFGEKIEDLSLALMTWQQKCRRVLSKSHADLEIGPDILELMQPEIRKYLDNYLSDTQEVDELFCQGLVWQATNECHLWWHRPATAGNSI